MIIFLVGFMGSGKTYIGRRLSERLGFRFIDLDEIIETTEGVSIAHIFEQEGEPVFRKKESAHLKNIDNQTDTVVSTGGGAPCFHNNMEWMNQNGFTIYLKSPATLLLNRLKNEKDHRPLLKNKSDAALLHFIRQKIKERSAYYHKASLIFYQRKNDDTVIDKLVEKIQSYNLRIGG